MLPLYKYVCENMEKAVQLSEPSIVIKKKYLYQNIRREYQEHLSVANFLYTSKNLYNKYILSIEKQRKITVDKFQINYKQKSVLSLLYDEKKNILGHQAKIK